MSISVETTSPENHLYNILRHITTLPLMQLPENIELSRPATTLLSWVSTSPGCGVVDIARGLQLSPPTISVGIRRLVKGGWLERRYDPEDRRARPIYLTPKGEEFMARLRAHQTVMFRIFLSGLNDDEQVQLLGLLERAVDAMVEPVEDRTERTV
jgi:DNA-binding MarR family transcriptional regulator